MRIARLCVDTGGQDTGAVYGHLRRLRDPRIAPTGTIVDCERVQVVQGQTVIS
jgi:phage terminase large subunit GpA-like protein